MLDVIKSILSSCHNLTDSRLSLETPNCNLLIGHKNHLEDTITNLGNYCKHIKNLTPLFDINGSLKRLYHHLS